MCSFQCFLSGARYLQNVVDMMKVWVLKFPEVSEPLSGGFPARPAAAPSSPRRISTWPRCPYVPTASRERALPRLSGVHGQTVSSRRPRGAGEALAAAFLSGRYIDAFELNSISCKRAAWQTLAIVYTRRTESIFIPWVNNRPGVSCNKQWFLFFSKYPSCTIQTLPVAGSSLSCLML